MTEPGTSDSPSNQQIFDLVSRLQQRLDQIEKQLGSTGSGSSSAEQAPSSAHSDEVFVGAIDQGTTSSRFLIFNKDGEPVASHQIEFKQIYPQPG